MPSGAKNSKAIRILLVDDHAMVRQGIRSWLENEPHFRIVGEANDGAKALKMIAALKPDVVLLDLNLPRMSGFAVAEALRLATATSSKKPKSALLAVTIDSTRNQMQRLLASGVMGYVLKDAAPAELIRAVETVAAGQVYIGADAAQFLFEPDSKKTEPGCRFDATAAVLTPREVEVLKLIAEEFVTKEIAAKLEISVRTVEAHRERLMRKLKIRTFAGLTRYAIATGLTQI